MAGLFGNGGAPKVFGKRAAAPTTAEAPQAQDAPMAEGPAGGESPDAAPPGAQSQLEAVQALKDRVGAILAPILFSKGVLTEASSFIDAIRDYENEGFAQAQCYTENGQTSFCQFGHFSGETSVSFQQMESLFFLAGDLALLKAVVGKPPVSDEELLLRQVTAVNVAVRSSYLLHYLDLAIHTLKRVAGEEPTVADSRSLAEEATRRFLDDLQVFAARDEFYRREIASRLERDELPAMPISPVVMGYVKTPETVRLNIYLSDECAQAMRAFLAEEQCKGLEAAYRERIAPDDAGPS